jgi:hypothetical protein
LPINNSKEFNSAFIPTNNEVKESKNVLVKTLKLIMSSKKPIANKIVKIITIWTFIKSDRNRFKIRKTPNIAPRLVKTLFFLTFLSNKDIGDLIIDHFLY